MAWLRRDCVIFLLLARCCKSLHVNKVTKTWKCNYRSTEWALEHKKIKELLLNFRAKPWARSNACVNKGNTDSALVHWCHALRKTKIIHDEMKVWLHQCAYSLCPKTGCYSKKKKVFIKGILYLPKNASMARWQSMLAWSLCRMQTGQCYFSHY